MDDSESMIVALTEYNFAKLQVEIPLFSLAVQQKGSLNCQYVSSCELIKQ